MRRYSGIAALFLLLACGEPSALEHKDPAEPATTPSPSAASNAAAVTSKQVDKAPWPALAHATIPSDAQLVFSKVRFLWIKSEPKEAANWIGYLALGEAAQLKGGSSKLADAGAGDGGDCSRWYAIEPRGFVCVGADATLDGDDPDIVELRKGAAKHEPWPYEYGKSTGTTVYLNVPPKRRQYFRESAYHDHMEQAARARKLSDPALIAAINPALEGVDLRPTGNPPPKLLLHLGPRSRFQKAGGKYGFPQVAGGSTIAYFYSFDADERSWVMSWDRGIIPKDRVMVYPRSKFHGVALGDGVKLPLAFFRKAQPKLRRTGKSVEPTGASWPRYGWVGLTGDKLTIDGQRYLVTTEAGLLCRPEGLSLPRLRNEAPSRLPGAGKRTWVDISITGGWLVAYEGKRAVYATMVSPGRGGMPRAGKTLLETASTPVGDFAISAKFHTATMTSNFSDKVVHSEVPYTQNFSGPYALHSAYWHDDWGVGKSGGCVNLAPIDAMRLFAWTEPRLPAGWHGMRGIKSDAAHYASATVVSVHR